MPASQSSFLRPLLGLAVLGGFAPAAQAACPTTMPDGIFKDCISSELAGLYGAVVAAIETANDLQDDVDALEAVNTDLEATVADLQAQLDAANASIDANSSDIVAVMSDYATVGYVDGAVGALDLSPFLVSDDLAGLASESYVDAAVAGAGGGIEGLADYLSVDTATDAVIFTGANVYIQSGSGATDGSVNGLGNLIVGYDEDDGSDDKTGSHNLVVGIEHSYTSYGGLITGENSATTAKHAAVLGGLRNLASGTYAVSLGGYSNQAESDTSVITGGLYNETGASYTLVAGGYNNLAASGGAATFGGADNTVSGTYASIHGGNGITESDASDTSLGDYMTVDTASDSVIISGANVYVQSGAGATYDSVNGLGNLIVGYDEDDGSDDKSGSHNLVLGEDHTYTSYGAIITGKDHYVSGITSVALGGSENIVSGRRAAVIAGQDHDVSGNKAFIGGGTVNLASGLFSSVTGGFNNTASGENSSVAGGINNVASGDNTSVLGGSTNDAGGISSTISGGYGNGALGDNTAIAGGEANHITAAGDGGSIAGGLRNTVDDYYGTILGGQDNTVSHRSSAILGGDTLSTTTEYENVY